MRFQTKNTDLFPLPGNTHMLHIATISYGLREFVLMVDRNTGKMYIEEVVLQTVDFQKDVWANYKFIADDSLAKDIAEYCDQEGLRDMRKITERCIDMGYPEWTQPSVKILSR